MSTNLLPQLSRRDFQPKAQSPIDAETLAGVSQILADVRSEGAEAVRRHAEDLGDLKVGDDLVVEKNALDMALATLDAPDREVLQRAASRITEFAHAQLDSLRPLSCSVAGGRAGHDLVPVERVGCYAPGGRYPLPSSVLMTVIPARVAGAADITLASPCPAPITLAAASLAGANRVLAVGGAQAIGAMAYGAGLPAADFLCGPGNRWVTAAKQLVFGTTGVDMLAGPSELLVVADAKANPSWIAADLLAQAEHDPDARPYLFSTDVALLDAVERELQLQIPDLASRSTCIEALRGGAAVACSDLEEAIELSDALAPEHLALHLEDAAAVAPRFRHAGAIFIGARAAEAFGDYGLGPNHALPTSRGARHRGGLSVFDFLRVRTWMELRDATAAPDIANFARLESLEAHARSAELRSQPGQP